MWHRYSLSSFCSALWDSWASGSLKKKLKPAFGRQAEIADRVQAFWFPRLAAQTMTGSKAPTRAPSAGEWIRGGLLAWPDEGQRLRGEQGANNDTGRPGKTGSCWRDRMKKQGFAGSKAPTRAPSAGEKAARVGVGGRRNKASPGARRQHALLRDSNSCCFQESGRN